jgi:thymidylate kinase
MVALQTGVDQIERVAIRTMQIELTGCTGAGKSTLSRAMLQVARERGVDLLMADAFVLRRHRLDWVKNHAARTLLIDLLSLFTCAVTWRRHREFFGFARRIIFRLPIGWLEKLNLMRNVLKKMGIYEIVQRHDATGQMVLVDEGTLHAAHNLFVHTSVAPDADGIRRFAGLAPLPDRAIYVTQSEEILIDRTHVRGHKRIRDGAQPHARLFVERALETFDRLREQPQLEGRLWMVDALGNVTVDPKDSSDPHLATALKIVRAGLEIVTAYHPSRPEWRQTTMVLE